MNQLKWLLLLALVLAFFAGCSSTPPIYLNASRPMELTRVEREDGRTEIYKLDLSYNQTDLTLTVQTQRTEQRPDLGLTLREIDKNLARRKELVPFKGLFVERVKRKGPADIHGILPGDVILSVNGIELRYEDQYEHVLKTRIGIENEVDLVVLRGHENRQEERFTFIPHTKSVLIPSTKAIPLDRPSTVGPAYAGFVAGTLPAEWTEKIYDDNRPTVLIGGVYVGSPAYVAGIRTGDRILSVNGRHFESADELKRQIQDWGARGEKVRFEVFQHQGGPFSTEVNLKQFDTRSSVLIPLVFSLDSSVSSTEWTILPFGILAWYDSNYRRSNSRGPNYSAEFGCLLGLYKRKWSQGSSRTRLLWFIKFGSR